VVMGAGFGIGFVSEIVNAGTMGGEESGYRWIGPECERKTSTTETRRRIRLLRKHLTAEDAENFAETAEKSL